MNIGEVFVFADRVFKVVEPHKLGTCAGCWGHPECRNGAEWLEGLCNAVGSCSGIIVVPLVEDWQI